MRKIEMQSYSFPVYPRSSAGRELGELLERVVNSKGKRECLDAPKSKKPVEGLASAGSRITDCHNATDQSTA
jgi:hypothetical protein